MPDRFESFVVGRKIYLRTVSVVMACHAYNAIERSSVSVLYDATWQPKWWGGKVLTLREHFPLEVLADAGS